MKTYSYPAMNGFFSFILCILFLFGLCACNKTEPEEAPGDITEQPGNTEIEVFKANEWEIYTFCKDDNSFFFQYALTDSNNVNFRIFVNDPDVQPSDAIIYTARADENNGELSFEFADEFLYFKIKCDKNTAEIQCDNSDFSGTYYSVRYEREETVPEIPVLPQYSPDKNTDGFEMDSTLAKEIRKSEQLDPDALLTREMLANIKSLQIFGEKIVSLKGIEYLPNLEELSIDINYLRDISILSKLKNLKSVNIGSGYITRIPDLSGMNKLEQLAITANLISDLSPLSDAPSLKYVNLDVNRITSIAPIKDIDGLLMLELGSNCITDYNTVADNDNIREAMAYTGISLDTCIMLENRVKSIVAEIIDDDMSELEKEYAVYRYVIDNTECSVQYRNREPFGYYGIMKGFGVCGDYAEEFALIGRMAGLDVICVSSDTHVWNIVKLGEKYYNVDTLWDDNDCDIPEYFNRSSAYILGVSDHQHDLNKYPVASEMDYLLYAQLLNQVVSLN